MSKEEKRRREKEVQNPACDYARKRGMDVSIVRFENRSGAADRMFIKLIADGLTAQFFIEFKRPIGGKVSELQKVFFRDMARQGVPVYLGVRDIQAAKYIIDWHMKCITRCPNTEQFTPDAFT